LLDVNLDERASELFLLPRRRGFAGAQAHNHVLPAHRLAGVKRHVLDDAVALVEDSQHRDPLRHGRNPAFSVSGGRDLPRRRQRRVLLGLALAARSERERGEQRSG
jgi:hypothetical protein